MKVQVSIRGDELRVSGTKKDMLQDAIQIIKNLDIKQPLQFINFQRLVGIKISLNKL